MNPPKIDICIEGYNIEQTDFYIGQLIEKYTFYRDQCQKCENKIRKLEEENEKLRTEILTLIKSISDKGISINSDSYDTCAASEADNESEINTVAKEQLKNDILDLQSELDGIKSLFSK